ncbi:MAG: DUF917 family protein [Bifidobacteriaceae bacterium]|jgi:DUF917 family protein|nr:DUF917 family protein [Bifidobacteriaceae bacterium]
MTRELTKADALHGVLGGGVLACGGGGWKRHGELMGDLATSLGRPSLASVRELPEDTIVATVTAIGAPAAENWEIRPVDYLDALTTLMRQVDGRIGAVMTAQNGFSTTHNGWIQSAALGIPVLDAAGDVRAHPTGKLGSLGLGERPGYTCTAVVAGGNRQLAGRFVSINVGDVNTCDDVLRDISVRVGGFIASARNPVELAWVKDHAALGAISLALDLGEAMREAGAGRSGAGNAVAAAVAGALGAEVLARGPLVFETPNVTKGGWDHGVFRVQDCLVPFLNEFMAVQQNGEWIFAYPATICLLDGATGEPMAVERAVEGQDCVLLAAPASALPVSSSAIDPAGLAECAELLGIDFLAQLDPNLRGGSNEYAR